MRLIDAGSILKRAEESFKNAGLHGEDYRKFKKWLRATRTIDAVEVVRCKDCRYATINKHDRPLCTCVDRTVRLNDYCSYGERDTTA